jgi:hypothetical protein
VLSCEAGLVLPVQDIVSFTAQNHLKVICDEVSSINKALERILKTVPRTVIEAARRTLVNKCGA